MSSTQDKILNQFKTVGLGEFVTLDNPIAKEGIYCMDNKTVYGIKLTDLSTFIDKCVILNHFSSKFVNFSTLSGSKLAASTEDKTICS